MYGIWMKYFFFIFLFDYLSKGSSSKLMIYCNFRCVLRWFLGNFSVVCEPMVISEDGDDDNR